MKNRTRGASKHCCNLFFRQVATLGVDAVHDLNKRNEANIQKNNNFSENERKCKMCIGWNLVAIDFSDGITRLDASAELSGAIGNEISNDETTVGH